MTRSKRDWHRETILLTVKAYPETSKKYGPLVCCAGITKSGEWIRLYPLPWDQFWKGKLRRYTWIEAEVKWNPKEKFKRPESHKVRDGSVRVVDSSLSKGKVDWDARNAAILPKLNRSVEELVEAFDDDRTSLGLVKPREVADFHFEGALSDVEKGLNEAIETIQTSLYGRRLPKFTQFNHIFKYRYLCAGDSCNEHRMQCEDWELFESVRTWRRKYPNEDVLWEKLKEKYYDWMRNERDLYFYLGTHSLYPSWMIIGLYYPPVVS